MFQIATFLMLHILNFITPLTPSKHTSPEQGKKIIDKRQERCLVFSCEVQDTPTCLFKTQVGYVEKEMQCSCQIHISQHYRVGVHCKSSHGVAKVGGR